MSLVRFQLKPRLLKFLQEYLPLIANCIILYSVIFLINCMFKLQNSCHKLLIVKIFILLFFLISSFVNANEISNQSTDVSNDQKEVVVGLLRTEKETYPYEWEFSDNIYEMLTYMGANVLLIDYNKIVDFDKIKKEALSEAKKDQLLANKLELDKIKVVVQNFIEENKINRIFIAGNYYNLDYDPFPPTPNRQLVTEAIVKIVDDNPNIHIIAICGGLQGVMHAKGVEIIRVDKLVDAKQQEAHLISMPNPQQENVHLHKLKIVPESRLGEIASKFIKPDKNGWFSVYFPDAHGGVVDTSNQNKQKLEHLGYKVVGFSDDGIIEVIEDKHGNLYFQDHPEALVIKSDKNYPAKEKERGIATLVAIAILNDFLYRE